MRGAGVSVQVRQSRNLPLDQNLEGKQASDQDTEMGGSSPSRAIVVGPCTEMREKFKDAFEREGYRYRLPSG